jgi:hypothetical protein
VLWCVISLVTFLPVRFHFPCASYPNQLC